MKLLLHCTKRKPYLEYKQIPRTLMKFDNSFEGYRCSYKRTEDDENFQLNGKIVGECDYEVEEIKLPYTKFGCSEWVGCEEERTLQTRTMNEETLLKKSCLKEDEIYGYLNFKHSPDNVGYAIHIKNLHIFDEPKELNEVYSIHNVGGMLLTDKLKKAPQNMQRISLKEWEYGTYNPNDIAILMSIYPEWLCKILNGEKTIEIRKKVLKKML